MHHQRDHVMVCVTGQRTCERLIRHSAQFAKTLGCRVSVLHVADGMHRFMNSEDEAEAVEYLYQVSKDYGADMTVIRNDKVIETIAAFARKNGVTHIVLGGSAVTNELDVPARLRELLRDVEFHVIPSDSAQVGGSTSLPGYGARRSVSGERG